MRKINQKNRVAGFTVLELIAGVFILSVGIVGVSSLISRLLWYNRFVESKAIAAYLTQEGMEIVRNIRDGNWLEGKLGADWTEDLFCCDEIECSLDPGENNPCMADYLDRNLSECRGGVCPALEFDQINKVYGYDLGDSTKFTRIIEIWEIGTDQVRVCTTTEWTEQGKDQSIKACELLYNWYEPIIL